MAVRKVPSPAFAGAGSEAPRPFETPPAATPQHWARPSKSLPARRRWTHDARPSHRVPRDLLDPVVDFFQPQRVILFGSQARGEARRDSDIDLLVVVDDNTSPEKLHWQDSFAAYRSKRDADIFPIRAKDFERDRVVANTLAAEADIDGIVVYGSPKGSCTRRPDPRAVGSRDPLARSGRCRSEYRRGLHCRSSIASQRCLPLPAGVGKVVEGVFDACGEARRQDACARPVGSSGREEFS
jgi:uncharacterized protein